MVSSVRHNPLSHCTPNCTITPNVAPPFDTTQFVSAPVTPTSHTSITPFFVLTYACPSCIATPVGSASTGEVKQFDNAPVTLLMLHVLTLFAAALLTYIRPSAIAMSSGQLNPLPVLTQLMSIPSFC